MARAYPNSPPQDYDQEPAGEWQALRGELVSLLDQVESQVARTRRDDQGYQGISERMRDLRYQVSEAEPDMRHREALRSVKRAVDRLSDREEPYAPPGYAPRQESPNPRDTLQSAIQQIRSRHAATATSAPAPRAAEPPPPQRIELPHFDELAHAVGGISGRLERLESELRGAAKIQTGNVKEIAEQVAQLSHVVELLAGAVGETGQVKRLETQIAGLAKLVAQGPQVDLSALNRRLDDMSATFGKLMERQNKEGLAQRLDDVSATVGRLADLQVQYANRADNGGLKDGMAAIEDGVRHVYDRIDAIERSTALPPADLERLTDEMARVTEALRNPVHSERLNELFDLVENINRRVGSIESSSGEIGGLKADMAALRSTVAEALEPRFAALEMQIEALSDRIGEQPEDISVGQLEAQVRQLVARMDQTGEQLTGLARLYTTPIERDPAPDFEALADMVAARTSEAVANTAVPMTAATGGMNDAHIDEIEKRVSRLFSAAQAEKPNDDLGGIESSIREVNDRLARLESSLTERAKEAERLAALPPEPMPERVAAPIPTAYASPYEFEADPIAAFDQPTPTAAPLARGDTMPANPAVDAPLRDRPFGDDSSAIKAALDAKNGPRKHHPGLSYEPLPGQGDEAEAPVLSIPLPGFDPDAVARPPRPTSSFDTPARDVFAEPEAAAPAPAAEAATESSSTNTFIAAARRAAQRQQQQDKGSSGSGSLIARAFANFQSSKAAEEKPTATPAAKPEKLKVEKVKVAKPKPEKKKKGRQLAGDKQSPTAWQDDDTGAPVREPVVLSPRPQAPPSPVRSDLSGSEAIALDQEGPLSEEKPKESFLSRHRRPILLAAAIVAIAFLTLNLINQRLSPSNAVTQATPAVGDTSEADIAPPSTLSNEPFANVPAEVSGPRIIPMVDSLATASIDPAASKGFSPAAEVTAIPASFAPTTKATSQLPAATAVALDAIETASLPALADDVTPLESPVQVEMPPVSVGPEPLRTAAANGDARAQFEIAAIYTEGRAVPEDLAAAAIWYERAAAQGFAPAQYRLGNLYENGRGVEKDLEQARLWYQRAAEAGNRMAMHNLAALYASGQLGKQEFDAAAEWFEQAAARGMRDSQFNLGMLYARGLGVTQNLEDSYKWFSIAAQKGDADAGKARDDIARSLDAETVTRLNGELAVYRPATIDLAANFAPIGTWSATFDPGETIRAPEVIKSVQQALTSLGYDVGTPDGLLGPKTAEAIKAFERATGMSESGAINPRLLAVLGSQPV